MTGTGPGGRYVRDADIKSAVKGRETQVLDALGIPWAKGRPHIKCPYPTHGGDNDWRWDEKKAKAFCTCASGVGIFDVVIKCEGLDGWEAAKLRVAEIVAPDLIKTPAAQSGGPRISTKPGSALAPLPERARPDLPALYLAHRLGIAPADILMPTTKAVGWSAFPYWEPPKKRGGEPILFGEFPCIVFMTADVDNLRHAHCIYVAADGAGKADLGGREVKKAARKVDEKENIAGRSVYWGSPKKAAWLIICEGIETGQAVAQSFRAEIERFDVCVVAAINAVGVEAFKLWPETRRVTVAADRDEAKKDGRDGSLRGEQAARLLALRNSDAAEFKIALPGTEGETIDWLDVFVRNGAEAVRTGILGAAKFEATKEETESKKTAQSRARELDVIAAAFPLPEIESIPLRYAHSLSGAVKVYGMIAPKLGFGKVGRPEIVPVSTPFGVPARLRQIDQADAYGLRIVVQDMNSRPRTIDIDRAMLAKTRGDDIKSLLLQAGVRFEAEGEGIVTKALKAADPRREITQVRRPAWHDIDGAPGPVFVAPGGEIIGAPEGMDLELAGKTLMAPEIALGGTLEGWQKGAFAAAGVKDCQHWAIGLMAGFAGPIVALTGLDTCGANLSGMTSSGKTTAQKLAASIWSTPDICKPGLCQSARATANAIEALAERASGTVLSLDELAHISGKEAGKIIYTIAGGVGKSRMTQDASIRDTYKWTTFALLSGECSLEEKVTADGGEWMAGMAVRIVDIDVTGVNRSVPRETMAAIVEGIDKNFGHAGPAFVRSLVESRIHERADALRAEIMRTAQKLAGDKADSANLRAAQPFAIMAVAGSLAQKAGLLPADLDIWRVIFWAWGRFQTSSDAAALSPEDQALAKLGLWILERWDVLIKSTTVYGGARESVGWYDSDAVYIPKERLREAAGGTLKESAIAALLNERGLLYRREDKRRAYVRYVSGIGRANLYALTRKEFGRASGGGEPNLRLAGSGEQ